MSESMRLLSFLGLAFCLCSCASNLPSRGISDSDLISAAKAELRYVRNGLSMYQVDDDESSYPSTSQINSHSDLRDILSPYIMIPAANEATWTFNSYERDRKNWFILRATAHDKYQTVITVTPRFVHDVLESARHELTTVKNALGMFQAESDISAYPSTEAVTSHNDLKNIISSYVRIYDEDMAAFTFVSYKSAHADTFVLVAQAKDRDKTVFTVGPTSITPPPS